VAQNFNRFDIDTVEMIGVKVELVRYQFYEDGMLSLEPLQSTNQRAYERPVETIRQVTTNAGDSENEVEALRSRGSDEIRAIYDDLRARILALSPQIEERPTRAYVAYRATKNFVEIHIQRSQLRIFLRPIDYEDPRIEISKMPESYNWTLDRELRLIRQTDIDYVMNLIEQSYNDVI
jgi:predicted transport protein